MPQPINRVVSDPEVYLQVGILKDKPELAVLVAEIFSVWARIELELSYLVVRVLGADAAPAIAMYSTLTAQRLQLGALQAAAKAALAPMTNMASSIAGRAKMKSMRRCMWSP